MSTVYYALWSNYNLSRSNSLWYKEPAEFRLQKHNINSSINNTQHSCSMWGRFPFSGKSEPLSSCLQCFHHASGPEWTFVSQIGHCSISIHASCATVVCQAFHVNVYSVSALNVMSWRDCQARHRLIHCILWTNVFLTSLLFKDVFTYALWTISGGSDLDSSREGHMIRNSILCAYLRFPERSKPGF